MWIGYFRWQISEWRIAWRIPGLFYEPISMAEVPPLQELPVGGPPCGP
jgi:hypothetical protein